ncbi:MAG: hypothetical protein KDK40_00170 [Chlamydiia bacterium]|nr:hypothetical protein [Chlamydiia bacterium]
MNSSKLHRDSCEDRLIEWIEWENGVKGFYTLRTLNRSCYIAVEQRFRTVLKQILAECLPGKFSDTDWITPIETLANRTVMRNSPHPLHCASYLQGICTLLFLLNKQGQLPKAQIPTPYLSYLSERVERSRQLRAFIDHYHLAHVLPKITWGGLTELCLFLHSLTTTQTIPDEITHNPHIKYLQINTLTDIRLLTVFWDLKQLKSLRIGIFSEHLDAGVFKGFDRLTNLNIDGNKCLNQIDLSPLTKLEILSLKCIQSSFFSSDQLPIHLHSLALIGCFALERQPDLTPLRELRELSVQFCSIRSFTSRKLPPLLQKLSLLDPFDTCVIESLPKLESLELRRPAPDSRFSPANLTRLCLLHIRDGVRSAKNECSPLWILPPYLTQLAMKGQLTLCGSAIEVSLLELQFSPLVTCIESIPSIFSYFDLETLSRVARTNQRLWWLVTEEVNRRWWRLLKNRTFEIALQGAIKIHSSVDWGLTEKLSKDIHGELMTDRNSCIEWKRHLSERLSLRKILWCRQQLSLSGYVRGIFCVSVPSHK